MNGQLHVPTAFPPVSNIHRYTLRPVGSEQEKAAVYHVLHITFYITQTFIILLRTTFTNGYEAFIRLSFLRPCFLTFLT